MSEFWASHIPGDTAIVRLFGRNPQNGQGFVIDKWVRGYEQEFIRKAAGMIGISEAAEIDHGSESKPLTDMRDVVITGKSKAVARLLVNGKYAGAAFLIGCEGHVMTTYDCIRNQEDADNTDFAFMPGYGLIHKVVEASSGKLV